MRGRGPRRRRGHVVNLPEFDRLNPPDQLGPLNPLDTIDQRLERLKREAALRMPVRLPAEPKPRRLGAFLTLVVFVLAVAGGVLLVRRSDGHHPATASSPHVAAGTNDTTHVAPSLPPSPAPGTRYGPPAGIGEQASRLLAVPTAPAGSGGYKLLNPELGPPRYDPCRPIHYVIRDQNTPAGGDALIRQAVAAVSKATGLKFIDDGTTTEKPSLKRPPYLPAEYGNRWAPVLIAWSNPTEITELKGATDGLGASTPYSRDPASGYAYVSGAVFLDAPQLSALDSAPQGAVEEKVTIEHELGHVVGLAHVTDPHQVMFAVGNGLSNGYGAGDLRGLAYEGGGACHPEL